MGTGARALACAVVHYPDSEKQTGLMEGKTMGFDQLIKLSPHSKIVMCSGPGWTWTLFSFRELLSLFVQAVLCPEYPLRGSR